MPILLPESRCALTAPFHPYRQINLQAVYSLLHWPSAYAAQTLSGTLPFGARTFLPLLAQAATVWLTQRSKIPIFSTIASLFVIKA
ncbi:MAG: hypothetical protein ACI9E9_000526 [Reinekea sp.]|jgi:hypothetical protein